MFDVNMLTGHVRIGTRREVERLAAAIAQPGGAPEHLKEACVLVACDGDGNLFVDDEVQLNDERYIIVQIASVSTFAGDTPANVGSTFDLADLWPDGLPEGVSYYLVMNQTPVDVNLVLDARPLVRPADTVVKAGYCREASLYVGQTGHVLTVSDDLIMVD